MGWAGREAPWVGTRVGSRNDLTEEAMGDLEYLPEGLEVRGG